VIGGTEGTVAEEKPKDDRTHLRILAFGSCNGGERKDEGSGEKKTAKLIMPLDHYKTMAPGGNRGYQGRRS